jgi:hypothetical protein
MQKIIYKLIKEFTKGVDTYTHNGSTWLIFTDTKQWVIELTKDRTLWYNYTFFNGMFSYCSIKVVDNQHYITQWVEDNIINGSKNTPSPSQTPSCNLVEVLENGVKETSSNVMIFQSMYTEGEVEEIIENGVKETQSLGSLEVTEKEINNTIQNGVKHTEIGWHQCNKIDDTIDKGVKEIKGVPLKTGPRNLEQFGQGYSLWKTETVINEGVKETKTMDEWFNSPRIVGEVIDNGVKENL